MNLSNVMYSIVTFTRYVRKQWRITPRHLCSLLHVTAAARGSREENLTRERNQEEEKTFTFEQLNEAFPREIRQ